MNAMPSKFTGALEAFDLSSNKLEGTIPSEMGKLTGATISLSGNEHL
jgi:hypothetical protein